MGEWPPDGGAESGSPGAGQVSASLEAVTLNPEDTVPGREHSPHLCHCQWVKVQRGGHQGNSWEWETDV